MLETTFVTINSLRIRRNPWSPQIKRYSYVKVVWHAFALGQSKLSNMKTVIWCVDYVSVVELSDFFQHTYKLRQKF